MSPVTERFITCYQKLKAEGKVRSARAFARELNFLPQSWNETLNGRRDVTIELIRRAAAHFLFNPTFIFTGEGNPIIEGSNKGGFRLITVLSPETGAEKIVHVPVPAQAGYTTGLTEPEFIQELPVFTLPDHRFKFGTHRCFDVSGDSMEPTLFEGDRVVCSFVEPENWPSSIKDGHVYVFVSTSEVLVKRAKNLLKERGEIILHSDNQYYTQIVLPGNEVKEVWKVMLKISPFLHSQPQKATDLAEQIKSLQVAIEQLSKK